MKHIAFIGTLTIAIIICLQQDKHTYTPRTNTNMERKDAIGYMDYIQSLRANPKTGSVDVKDVVQAYQQADILAAYKTSGLTLKWEELGPDNIGGRTRGFLIDKNNPKRVYAGSVSGGLWISENEGGIWKQYDDMLQNLSVSCITQAANGDVYFGTGEGFYTNRGDGTGGFMGQGIWKMQASDKSQQFNRLTATWDSISTTEKDVFSYINRLAADPKNSDRIYAATKRGLRMTNDGGKTWFIPKMSSGKELPKTMTYDVETASDGTVIVFIAPDLYKSPTGDDGSFNKVQTFAGSGSRHEFAISPSDPNYMYCVAANKDGKLGNVYQSKDKGNIWTVIGPGGSESFQPLGDQGDYDLAIAVDPANPQRIFLGGLTLWSWSNTQGWRKLDADNVTSVNPYYVHADKHIIRFHPTNPNICYIGSDGGITKTKNAQNTYPEFQTMNRGYNVTQFYSVAFSGDGKDIIGGTQDNGTQYFDGWGNTPKSTYEMFGGDGIHTAISVINPKAFFTGTQNGRVVRSSAKGESFNFFYDKFIDCEPKDSDGRCKGDGKPDGDKPEFLTPFVLWESINDKNSVDSVLFVAASAEQNIFSGNGTTVKFSGSVFHPQKAAKIVPGSIRITIGSLLITDDGNGKLTGNVAPNTNNTIDYTKRMYELTLSSPPKDKSIARMLYQLHYSTGDTLKVESATSGYPFFYVLNAPLNADDSLMIHDVVQSRYAIGLVNSVWLTNDPINFSVTPKWYKIATLSGRGQNLSFSSDGNHLFASAGTYNLYRISGISAISHKDTSGTDFTNSNKLTNTFLYTFSQTITDIAVDPNDANNVVVTLGNYGYTTHVYRSVNALSASPVFVPIQNNLPKMPVYSAVIDKTNSSRILLGTELGIWVSENNGASWTEQNNGMARVATVLLRQQTYDPVWNEATGTYPVTNAGVLYAATHGRGMFKCEDLKIPLGVASKQNPSNLTASSTATISIFPNPVTKNARILITLSKPSAAVINIYNMQGKLLRKITTLNLQAGNNELPFDSGELTSGVYLMQLLAENGNMVTTRKFIITN